MDSLEGGGGAKKIDSSKGGGAPRWISLIERPQWKGGGPTTTTALFEGGGGAMKMPPFEGRATTMPPFKGGATMTGGKSTIKLSWDRGYGCMCIEDDDGG